MSRTKRIGVGCASYSAHRATTTRSDRYRLRLVHRFAVNIKRIGVGCALCPARRISNSRRLKRLLGLAPCFRT